MTAETNPKSSSQPIRGFARFFRGYALGLSVIVASVPIVSGYFDLMPFFAGTKAIITGLASIGSYLLVAFLFFQRLSLAGFYFPLRRINDRRIVYVSEQRRIRNFGFLPGILTSCSLLFFALYIYADRVAVRDVAFDYGELKDGTPIRSLTERSLAERFPVIEQARLSLDNGSPFKVAFYKNDQGRIDWNVEFPDQQIVKQIRLKTPDVEQPWLLTSAALFLLAFLCAVGALRAPER